MLHRNNWCRVCALRSTLRIMKKITYALVTLVVIVVLSRYPEYVFTQNGLHSAWPTFSGVDKDTLKVSDGGTHKYQGTVFFGLI